MGLKDYLKRRKVNRLKRLALSKRILILKQDFDKEIKDFNFFIDLQKKKHFIVKKIKEIWNTRWKEAEEFVKSDLPNLVMGQIKFVKQDTEVASDENIILEQLFAEEENNYKTLLGNHLSNAFTGEQKQIASAMLNQEVNELQWVLNYNKSSILESLANLQRYLKQESEIITNKTSWEVINSADLMRLIILENSCLQSIQKTLADLTPLIKDILLKQETKINRELERKARIAKKIQAKEDVLKGSEEKTQILIGQVPEIFPDGNFLAHYVGGSSELTRRKIKGILDDGFLKSHFQDLKEGKVHLRSDGTFTELCLVSFWFNQIHGLTDQKFDRCLFVIPIKNSLGIGTYLEQGTDPGELRAVPLGWREKKDSAIFEDSYHIFSAYGDLDRDKLQGIYQQEKGRYENFRNPEMLTISGILAKYWRGTQVEKILESFESFFGFMRPVYRDNAESLQNLEPSAYSILGYTIVKEFNGRLPRKDQIPYLMSCARKTASTLMVHYSKILDLPDLKIPISPGILFVPKEQYLLWERYTPGNSLKPVIISISDYSEITAIIGHLPYPTIDSLSGISKIIGKYNESGSCVGYTVYGKADLKISEYDY